MLDATVERLGRENAIILVCLPVAFLSAWLGAEFTYLDDRLLAGLFLFVGVGVPQAINGYLDARPS